jgi:hypothetical protein
MPMQSDENFLSVHDYSGGSEGMVRGGMQKLGLS